MGQTASGDSDEEITGINVAPLVDVMLVLLVIFMVTASYIAKRSINVNLPKAETVETPPSVNLSFMLDKNSELFIDGQPTTFEALPEIIEAAKKDHGTEVQALIAADRETPHGAVIRLIDSVRKHGITEFAISVDTAPPSP